jgi:two-component system, cell cycle sensor histidine kinase and response regulator CckA
VNARLRALVVDETHVLNELVTRELHRAGFDATVVGVGTADAMREALAHGPWDMVISEHGLPRFGGLDALQVLQATGLDIPFIIVTGHISEHLAIELMRAGAHDYLNKDQLARFLPVVERELREADIRRERRRTEEALRASEQRYRELFENANDMVFTVDLDGRFSSINRAAELVMGYPREEALTMRLAQVVAPEDAGVVQQLQRLADRTEVQRELVQLTIIGRGQRRIPVELSWRLMVRHGRVIGLEAIARDMTERRRLEDQLRQAGKMEAIGRLAGGIAHDFNNLLMTVTGYSELMLERLDPDDPLRQTAEEILKAATRAAALTRQLLAFSRKQVLTPSVLDLNAVVGDLERMLRRVIGEDIEFVSAFTPGEAPVKADRGQIEQVLMNLVVNARDAMPHGGQLNLTTSLVKLPPGSTTFPGAAPGRYVQLEVRDTGLGMDTSTMSHLFEPFFTTKESGKGTGLGLSTVYGIVTQSGGFISVESEPSRGATFRVLLPRADEPVPRQATRGRFASLPRGSETVLLVEDETGVRELIRDFLARCGYTVLEAMEVPDAFTLFDAHADKLDLLITDVVMPQMNGRVLAEQLLARRPRLKVLYMSGYTDDQILVHGVATGAGFLQKPFTPDVLARKVRDVLDGPDRAR